MTLKNIKMWANNPQEARKIMDYMYSLGYKWSAGESEEYLAMQGFYGNHCGYLSYLKNDEEYFKGKHSKDYEEIFLPEKELEKAPPIGLRPKATVDSLRIQEILEAMTRYAADGKAIPQDWIDELSIRNSERIDYAG